MTVLSDLNLCFLGAGSMAEALIRGLLMHKRSTPEKLAILNRSNMERLHALNRTYDTPIIAEAGEKLTQIAQADVIIIATKPKDALDMLRGYQEVFRADQLFISVAAGVSIHSIQHALGFDAAVARAMPNTSSTIGLGATAISFSNGATSRQRKLSLSFFESVGIAKEVEESQLNVVTGLSGSGPAYIYYMMEALIEAGVDGGLSREDASALTVQTVLGAAQMVATTHEQPAVLRAKVTSPNGTTQAALEWLQEAEFASIVKAAVSRATERAVEIGRSLEADNT